jgi:phosphoribosylformylglycinamidine cyclo-ligase
LKTVAKADARSELCAPATWLFGVWRGTNRASPKIAAILPDHLLWVGLASASTLPIIMSTSPTPLSYKAAGVDIDAGDALVERIKPLAKKTMRDGVLAGIGGFGALFEVPKRYKEPVLVSGTDGVGTKLKLAFEWNMHDTVGIDLVAMSVNDVLVQGAEPLFFLDYFACGKLDVDTAAAVVGGIAKGCELSGCALIGGETAEMPGMYPAGEYDLAGFAVGAVEKSKILTGAEVKPGDVVLGLASSGVHSNGFSLVRKCIERAGASAPATLDSKPFKQALMEPTRLYVKNVLAALAAHPIKALAHITGGGLLENIPRVLPEGMAAHLVKGSWPQTELFAWLQATAGIDDIEMNRTFNNGIGMVVVIDAAHAAACAATLRAAGETVYEIGVIAPIGSGAAVVVS